MARIESEAAKALKTMANNAIAQNKHLTPKDWATAKARVKEYEEKGLRLDGAPQSSSIYGAAARGGVPTQVQRKPEPEPETEEERKAREHREMEEALARYREKKRREQQRQRNAERRAATAAADRKLAERILRDLAVHKEGKFHEARSHVQDNDQREPQGSAGAIDTQAGADGVRSAQARGDRERGNEDRGDPLAAPDAGRGIGRGRGLEVTEARKEEIRRLYIEGGMTYAQIARATGYSHGHIWTIVNKKEGPDKRRRVPEEKRAEIIAKYEAGEKSPSKLARICNVSYSQAKAIVEKYARDQNAESGTVVLYPGLERWRIEHGMSHSAMARICGISQTSMTNIIYGRAGCDNVRGPHKIVIDQILEGTGLTYEEAFKRDVRRTEK